MSDDSDTSTTSADTTTDTTTDTDDTGLDDHEAQQLLADALAEESDTETGTDSQDWKAEAERLAAELKKWQHTARRNEQSAKNAQKSVQDQLADLRRQIEERDEAYTEANAKRAMSQVHTRLATAGIKPEDVKGLLGRIDARNLLKDGQPDDDAINDLATSLTKVAGRVTPDHDQGRKGGSAPPNMNDLIRRAAGVRI